MSAALRRQLHVSATASAVAQAIKRLDCDCESFGMSKSARFQLQVCLAELLNNIVEHGYRDCSDGAIQIRLRVTGGICAIRLDDNGAAFQPPCQPADPWGENGRGLAIVEAWSDGLKRRRRGGVNQTLLVRRRR